MSQHSKQSKFHSLPNLKTRAMKPAEAVEVVGGWGWFFRYNQAETLASSVQKKDSDTEGQVIGKI